MKQLIIILVLSCLSALSLSAQDNNKDSGKNDILKSGFFIDGLIQAGSLDIGMHQGAASLTASYSNFSAGLRLGNKWFFGEGKVYRPGIVATWMRNDIIVNSYRVQTTYNNGQTISVDNYDARPGQFFAIATVDPVNIGFSNGISFNKNMGLEIDITGGLSAVFISENMTYTSNNINLAGVFGATIKFRYKTLSIGVDFCHRQIIDMTGNSNVYSYERALNSIGLTIGGKF